MYNVPSRTGCGLNPETIAHLVKNVDNIVGLKDATGDLSHAAKTMNLCDGKLELYSGNDDQVVPLLSLGGIGFKGRRYKPLVRLGSYKSTTFRWWVVDRNKYQTFRGIFLIFQ